WYRLVAAVTKNQGRGAKTTSAARDQCCESVSGPTQPDPPRIHPSPLALSGGSQGRDRRELQPHEPPPPVHEREEGVEDDEVGDRVQQGRVLRRGEGREVVDVGVAADRDRAAAGVGHLDEV